MAQADSRILQERGIILVCGQINRASAENVGTQLLAMNTTSERDFDCIQITVSSAGGNCHDAFMLIDLIEYSQRPVHITGLGVCGSMGILILSSGEKGRRLVTRNTALLSHQYHLTSHGQHHELVADRKGQDWLYDRMMRHYLNHSRHQAQDLTKAIRQSRISDTSQRFIRWPGKGSSPSSVEPTLPKGQWT